jgi:hypothetical protein
MAVNLSPVGGVAGQFFDNNGNPLSGGKIFTYAAGTTTNQVTYTSATGNIAHSNPIILDSGGRVPSGEIWLTDGLQYKFVIKTSTDQAIGTFDNIVGINSNFVNFTTSEEVQIATAGQTVFTLTTMSYQPGTNNLVVYVDGVNQYEGSTYSFIETSSTVVTFTAGLHVGALVKFVSAEALTTNVTTASNTIFTGFKSQAGTVQDLADDDGSDWIGFEPSGTGAVARSAQDKMRETVSVKDFGAVGDGVADDTAAIQDALDCPNDVFFPAGAYLITASLDLSVSKRITGEGGPSVGSYPGELRTQCVILPRQAGNTSLLGNYPVFKNKAGITGNQWNITGFNIFWENVTPTNILTEGDRIGFKFVPDGTPQFAAPFSTFTDIEVNGAWYVYYDDSDNYLNTFKNVTGRFSKLGFYKRLGTLMRFEECSNSIGEQAFVFETTVCPMLINCAGDSLTPLSTSLGSAAVYFAFCNSFTIQGYDAELASLSNGTSYFKLRQATGTVSGYAGIDNDLASTVGNIVSWLYITDNANVTVSGFNRKFSVAGFDYTGNGEVATISCDSSSYATIIGSNVSAPTGGSPSTRYSIKGDGGNVNIINTIIDNTTSNIGSNISGTNATFTNANFTTALTINSAITVRAGTAAPVVGSYGKGDIVFNSNATAGGYVGFVCVAGGTPGTWKEFGAIVP